MTKKTIKASDVLGDNYYIYELSSSNYTPALNGTITITCTVTDVYGDLIGNKSIILYKNGTSVSTKTTNSSGVATWSVTCSDAGIQSFKVGNKAIEVFVDNKSNTDHTHSNYVTTSDSRLSDARTPTSHAHGNLQNNGQVGSTAQANKNVVTNSSGLITTEDKPTIPSKTSQLTNDSGFLTSHQSLDSKTVTVEKLATAESGYLSSYAVKQNGVQVGNTINIPKDFLVKSGSVKTVNTANNPVQGYSIGDKYIDLVINTKDASGTDEHIYILVSDLVTSSIAISDVTNLQTTLNSKIDTAGTGLSKSGTTLNHSNSLTALGSASFKKIKYDANGHITGTANVVASDLPSHTHSYATLDHTHYTSDINKGLNVSDLLEESYSDAYAEEYMNSGGYPPHENLENHLAYINVALNHKSNNNHTHSQYLTAHQDISGKIDTAGTGLSKSGTTLNHSNSITALTTTSFKKIKYDAQGHITGTTDVTASDLPSHTHSAYVNPTIADNLTTDNSAQVLSAKQGKVLNDTKADKSQVVDWDNIVFVDKADDATGSIILNFLS